MAKTMNHQAFEGCFQEFNRYLKEHKYSASIILSKTLRLIKQENAFTKRIFSESKMPKLFNSVHFGLRGCKEHRQMTWGDVQLHMEADGTEYLEYSERQTKTRTGAKPRNVRRC